MYYEFLLFKQNLHLGLTALLRIENHHVRLTIFVMSADALATQGARVYVGM